MRLLKHLSEKKLPRFFLTEEVIKVYCMMPYSINIAKAQHRHKLKVEGGSQEVTLAIKLLHFSMT